MIAILLLLYCLLDLLDSSRLEEIFQFNYMSCTFSKINLISSMLVVSRCYLFLLNLNMLVLFT